jgi:rod shape-determining protein MreC
VVTGRINQRLSRVTDYFALGKTNELLARDNIELRNQVAILSTKLEKVNSLLRENPIQPLFTYYPAIIINNSTNKQYNYLTLNIGSKDGVKQEMGVVTNQGVIGIVAGVSENYSTVISLLNIDLKISAKHKKTQQFGSMFWDGINYREVVLSDIPQHVKVSIGDTIVTSGFSSIFPPEIDLGVIKSFDNTGSNFHTITVELFIDFRQIHNVWVVSNRHGDERQILENSSKHN